MTSDIIVYLNDNSAGKLVEATLTDTLSIREIELNEEKYWKPAIKNGLKRLEEKGIPKDQWPQHTGWSWRAKHKKFGKAIAYKFFGIRYDGKLQGLMLLSTLLQKARAKEHEGKPILYARYIETAPWNLKDFADQPKYSLVGTNFISMAIQVSKQEECEGRLSLHSLPQSDEFYLWCGMINLGADPNFDNLNYFEMTKQQAGAFNTEEKQP